MSDNDIQHAFADVNGTRLHYARTGTGPLIVLLHGFPQGWWIFRRQLEELGRDHTAVAVDLRGFNRSAKPDSPWEYGTWLMVEDVRALVAHLGFERFTLVGHDTGGAVGYSFALHHPELLERLAILCTAHPALFDRELRDNREQIAASRYLLAVRRPEAAETLAASDFAQLEATLRSHDFFSEEDVQLHRAAWGQPRGAEGLLGWYRREGLGPREDGTPPRGNYVPEVAQLVIATPSLVLYAEHDAYVLPACFAGLEEYMPNADVRQVDGATHWLLDEHPDLVTAALRELMARSTPVRHRF
jgi:pimeloyl-ACP methyl ester carboxylesterase